MVANVFSYNAKNAVETFDECNKRKKNNALEVEDSSKTDRNQNQTQNEKNKRVNFFEDRLNFLRSAFGVSCKNIFESSFKDVAPKAFLLAYKLSKLSASDTLDSICDDEISFIPVDKHIYSSSGISPSLLLKETIMEMTDYAVRGAALATESAYAYLSGNVESNSYKLDEFIIKIHNALTKSGYAIKSVVFFETLPLIRTAGEHVASMFKKMVMTGRGESVLNKGFKNILFTSSLALSLILGLPESSINQAFASEIKQQDTFLDTATALDTLRKMVYDTQATVLDATKSTAADCLKSDMEQTINTDKSSDKSVEIRYVELNNSIGVMRLMVLFSVKDEHIRNKMLYDWIDAFNSSTADIKKEIKKDKFTAIALARVISQIPGETINISKMYSEKDRNIFIENLFSNWLDENKIKETHIAAIID